tara:strand:+ start:8532 stop:9173 length:642 start_codon:yes stop_codon:yes gene_type:complete
MYNNSLENINMHGKGLYEMPSAFDKYNDEKYSYQYNKMNRENIDPQFHPQHSFPHQAEWGPERTMDDDEEELYENYQNYENYEFLDKNNINTVNNPIMDYNNGNYPIDNTNIGNYNDVTLDNPNLVNHEYRSLIENERSYYAQLQRKENPSLLDKCISATENPLFKMVGTGFAAATFLGFPPVGLLSYIPATLVGMNLAKEVSQINDQIQRDE